jgi:cytoskeletal protein RodZ
MPGNDARAVSRKQYERKLVLWLALSYLLIALVAAGIMLWAALPLLWPARYRRRR